MPIDLSSIFISHNYFVLSESDNESVPPTPLKTISSRISVKTLEQIKLDRIQAESAAYYSFTDDMELVDDDSRPQDTSFQVLSIEEIRRRKRRFEEVPSQPDSTTMKKEDIEEQSKINSASEEQRKKPIRLKRCFQNIDNNLHLSRVRLKRLKQSSNAAVSSTNVDTPMSDDFLNDELPCSSFLEPPCKSTDDELLKDIDALLGD